MRLVLIVALGASLLSGGVAHATEDYGLPGQPIHLVVGYQPYFTPTRPPDSDGTRIRIIATTCLAHDLCNILLVRRDAPAFAQPEDAFKWIGQVAGHYCTCAYAFALQLPDHSGKPCVIIDATPELINRAFSTGHVDAAVVWEPYASQAVQAGFARRAATGATIGALSGAFIVAREDLLNQRPDAMRTEIAREILRERAQ